MLKIRNTNTTTKTWVAYGNSHLACISRYINSTRGTSSNLRVTVGNSGLCCCTCMTYYWAQINSLVGWFLFRVALWSLSGEETMYSNRKQLQEYSRRYDDLRKKAPQSMPSCLHTCRVSTSLSCWYFSSGWRSNDGRLSTTGTHFFLPEVDAAEKKEGLKWCVTIMHWLLFVYVHHALTVVCLWSSFNCDKLSCNKNHWSKHTWTLTNNHKHHSPPNPHLTYTWPWALQTCVYHWRGLPLASFLPW